MRLACGRHQPLVKVNVEILGIAFVEFGIFHVKFVFKIRQSVIQIVYVLLDAC